MPARQPESCAVFSALLFKLEIEVGFEVEFYRSSPGSGFGGERLYIFLGRTLILLPLPSASRTVTIPEYLSE